jgi:anti-anti-sigma factor
VHTWNPTRAGVSHATAGYGCPDRFERGCGYAFAMTRTSLSFTRVPAATGVTLSLRGEIDLSNVEALEAELEGALAEASDRLVIDLSGVTFCDSLGFSTLIKCWRAATASDKEFVLARPAPPVRRILEMMGISTVIRIVDETAV